MGSGGPGFLIRGMKIYWVNKRGLIPLLTMVLRRLHASVERYSLVEE